MKTDTQLIDELGGTSKVAEMFGVSAASVSVWRISGIPPARRQTLALWFPDKVPADWAPPGAVAAKRSKRKRASGE